jgi:hypothetical protein
VVGTHKDELTDYDVSKGTIRFQADKPLPAALVRKLIQARIAENAGRSKKSRNVAQHALIFDHEFDLHHSPREGAPERLSIVRFSMRARSRRGWCRPA